MLGGIENSEKMNKEIKITLIGLGIAFIAMLPDYVNLFNDTKFQAVLDRYSWVIYFGIAITSFFIGALINRKYSLEEIKYFSLKDYSHRTVFTNELYKSYLNAEREIILTGRGFTSQQTEFMQKTIEATKIALSKGVKITRIQTNLHTSETWNYEYLKLQRNFPETYQFVEDYENFDLANIAVIDCEGKNPIVQFLFEEIDNSSGDIHFESTVGIFIYNHPELAKSLKKQLYHRLKRVKESKVYHFAYGSNISSLQMQSRCPSMKKIGNGILYNYEFSFLVEAKHYQGKNVGGIRKKDNAKTWGVVYEISSNDKNKLSLIEEPGYYEKRLNIKLENSQEHIEAIVYLPNPEYIKKGNVPSEKYIETMIKGAEENNLNDLKKLLEELKENSA